MQPVLLVDFGSTYTKATAVDVDAGVVLDTARAFTTVTTDIVEGFQTVSGILDYRLGKLDYEGCYACSSAAGGLRMIAVGLVPDFTVEAARQAALSAGAKVIKVYSYELTPEDVAEIADLRPDIVLLTGGTDGGNTATIRHNAEALGTIPGDFPVVVAGNRDAANVAAQALRQAGKDPVIADNVLPNFNDINIAPARERIREVFLRRIVRAKGLTAIEQLIDGILMPTPAAVMEGLMGLAEGAEGERGVGNLMAVDVGGATTDVYSIGEGSPTRFGVMLKSLPEPYAKRTVEGDIGVRYSARSLVEAVGADAVAKSAGLERQEVLKGLALIDEAPDILPSDVPVIAKLDGGMTLQAIRTAALRHSGYYEFDYQKESSPLLQTGKDLTRIGLVIGTGGPVIGAARPRELLADAIGGIANDLALTPRKAEYVIDTSYILAAMGLLSQRHPAVAVRILKRELGL